MLYVYEFEVYEEEGLLVALPFDFAGGTQGKDMKEVALMAADWLKTECELFLIEDDTLPEPTFGNELQHEGRLLIVAVEASLDSVQAVPAWEAAEMLGVSRARVSQMVRAGLLVGFRKGRDAFVTIDSIEARKADVPKPGRPKRSHLHISAS